MVKKKIPKSKDYVLPKTKKKNGTEKNPYDKISEGLPKEAQAKFKEMKKNLDKFKDKLLSKFENYVIGISIMPPKLSEDQIKTLPPKLRSVAATSQRPTAGSLQSKETPKDSVEIAVLIDDADSRKLAKGDLKEKLGSVVAGMAKEINKDLTARAWLLSEVWQSAFDGKYDVLRMFASSVPFYDTGMLSALKITEIHKEMAVNKFERYVVSYVLAGSLVQGRATSKSDIDVFIVVDDTDVKKMTRVELKDKLRALITDMGVKAGEITGIKNKLNVQVYILTDFWDSVKEANPIIFTFLRDGIPLYDKGTFMPWKQLLKMGRVKPSSEAIDLYMSSGDQVINRARLKLKEIGMEDTFWAILTPTQAAIMLYGVPPPTPKETPEVLRELFVKKEKMLEEEYVKILERIIKTRKDLEHGDKKKMTGVEIDGLLSKCEKYLKRLDSLFKTIQKVKEKESMSRAYESLMNVVRDILRFEGFDNVKDAELVKVFEKESIKKGKIPAEKLKPLKEAVKAKKDYDEGKLMSTEVAKVKKDSNSLIRFLIEHFQRARGREFNRAKIVVKHGNKYGEVLMIDNEVFVIRDVQSQKKEISKGRMSSSGTIGALKESSLEELEKALSRTEVPPKVFVKEKIFENLKSIFGKDVEILINH